MVIFFNSTLCPNLQVLLEARHMQKVSLSRIETVIVDVNAAYSVIISAPLPPLHPGLAAVSSAVFRAM